MVCTQHLTHGVFDEPHPMIHFHGKARVPWLICKSNIILTDGIVMDLDPIGNLFYGFVRFGDGKKLFTILPQKDKFITTALYVLTI